MLYEDVDGLPGDLLLDAGTVAVDTTGEKFITIAESLPRGRIHGAFVSSGTPTIRTINVTNGSRNAYGAATLGATAAAGAPARANGSTAAPDPFGGSLVYTSNTTVIVALRAA
jgi:hypothetical protein